MNIYHIEYEVLTGLTKEEILQKLGFCFNDYISNVWMYRLDEKKCIFCKKYLYMYFENNIVTKYDLKRFKVNYLM